MKLLDLYEELFQYVCRLNRMAKTPRHPEMGIVRQEIKDLLARITQKASAEGMLSEQARKLELPVIFFVDNIICSSQLKFAGDWAQSRLALERNELAGDERFFELLDVDLADTSQEAAERLAVYYVCLGLGFTGMYVGQPEQLRIYKDKIFPRIHPWVDADPRSKISEEAYKPTDTRVLTEPPNKKIILVMIAFVFLSISILVIYYGMYAKAVGDLKSSVELIKEQSEKGETATP